MASEAETARDNDPCEVVIMVLLTSSLAPKRSELPAHPNEISPNLDCEMPNPMVGLGFRLGAFVKVKRHSEAMQCVRLPLEAGSVPPSTLRPEFPPSRRCPTVNSKGGSSEVLSFVPWALLGGCGCARLQRSSRRGISGGQAEIFQVPHRWR